MPLLAALVALAVSSSPVPRSAAQEDREVTLGRSYAQILAMGEDRWTKLYAKERGDSTPAIAGAFVAYGDALQWRNDGLSKGKTFVPPLRKAMNDYSAGLQGVGTALTEGGTIWQIFAAQSYRDAELALYRVLSRTGKAPRRVVSDVDRVVAPYAKWVDGIDDAKRRAEARRDLTDARAAFRRIVALAGRLPRRDSDVVLEFCRREALAVSEQSRAL